MIVTYDNDYGADYDGNRGITVVDDIILEDSDAYEIKEAIYEIFYGEDYDDTLCISLDVPELVDDQEFDVKISDYLTKEEYNDMLSDYREAIA